MIKGSSYRDCSVNTRERFSLFYSLVVQSGVIRFQESLVLKLIITRSKIWVSP